MNDGCGCLLMVLGFILLLFAFAFLGFCGPEAADNARWLLDH